MKPSEAIKILQLMNDLTNVELVFPNAQPVQITPKRPQLTEGEMAMLPMYKEPASMGGSWNPAEDDWSTDRRSLELQPPEEHAYSSTGLGFVI